VYRVHVFEGRVREERRGENEREERVRERK
jgi:hypothetical protein